MDCTLLNGMYHTPDAGHRSGDRQGCLRGTRGNVFLQLERWLKDVIAVYFCTYFSPFYPTSTPSLFHFHTLTNHEHQDKTPENIVLVQRNKHRLHCTQDGLPQDGLTASSYCLILDHRTLDKGHVVLLNPPLCNQLVDQAMLLNHALDLTGYSQFHDTMKPGGSYQVKIGLNITIQSRTHYLSYFQLGLGCDS